MTNVHLFKCERVHQVNHTALLHKLCETGNITLQGHISTWTVFMYANLCMQVLDYEYRLQRIGYSLHISRKNFLKYDE